MNATTEVAQTYCPSRTTAPEKILAQNENRKRVRFNEDGDMRQVKARVVEYRPLSEEFTDEERRSRWMQRSDKIAMRRSTDLDLEQIQMDDFALSQIGLRHICYSEAYTGLYYACHLEEVKAAEEAITVVSPGALLTCSQARGIEDRLVPQMAIERRLKRAKIIRHVVDASKVSKDAEQVKAISCFLTEPSRTFGEVLGVADATIALSEYQGSN